LSGAGLFIPFYFAVGCPTSLCHGCPCWQPGYLRRKSNFRVAQQKIWFEKRKFQKNYEQLFILNEIFFKFAAQLNLLGE